MKNRMYAVLTVPACILIHTLVKLFLWSARSNRLDSCSDRCAVCAVFHLNILQCKSICYMCNNRNANWRSLNAVKRTTGRQEVVEQARVVGKGHEAPHLQRRLGEAQHRPLHLVRQQPESSRQPPVEGPGKLSGITTLSQPAGTAGSGIGDGERNIAWCPLCSDSLKLPPAVRHHISCAVQGVGHTRLKMRGMYVVHTRPDRWPQQWMWACAQSCVLDRETLTCCQVPSVSSCQHLVYSHHCNQSQCTAELHANLAAHKLLSLRAK